jgi:hypothetical protein
MDGTSVDGQGYFIKRLDAGEGLGNIHHLQQNILIHAISSLAGFSVQYGVVNAEASALTTAYPT